MSHIEPDDLATLALDGGRPEGVTRAHLDECVECRTEYEALARTVELGRGAAEQELESPPSSVWAAIHGELALSPDLAADPLVSPRCAPPRPPSPTGTSHHARGSRRSPTPRSVRQAESRPTTQLPEPAAVVAHRDRSSSGGHRGRHRGRRDGGRPHGQPARIADRRRQRFARRASQAGRPPGRRSWKRMTTGCGRSSSNLDAQVPATEVREVWLIRSDASGLVSLGLLDGSSGRFVVPAGIDLGEFTLVDVSAEPIDGDPAHSGDSIVRGGAPGDLTRLRAAG